MIRFYCDKCGHKISVPQENAGKRYQCSKCNNVLIVPDKSTTIEFNCKNCGLRISVPKNHLGKEGRCPKCKSSIRVPGFKGPFYKPKKVDPDDTASRLLGNDIGLTLLEVPEEIKRQDLQINQTKVIENNIEQDVYDESKGQESESPGHRRLPWFIDIFLYPASVPGLTNLAVFTLIPTLMAVLRTLLGRAGRVIGIPGLIINVLLGLYMGWYFTECVRDSAKGNTRAPEAFAFVGAGEMWAQFQHIIGCFLILIAPSFFYSLYTQRTDTIYWGLLIIGSFFFPMGLLACIMFDSIRGLNPILLAGSILKTFFQYCGLVMLVAGILFTFTQLADVFESEETQQLSIGILFLGGVIFFIGVYVAFIIAHLIGRFYWRYEEKLNWEC